VSSIYTRLWLAAETIVTNAHATTPILINGVAVTIARSKTAMARELLDSLPALGVVIGDRWEASTPFSTRPEDLVVCVIQLVIIAASNRDQQVGGTDLLDARERVQNLFARPGLLRSQVPEVLVTDLSFDAPIARSPFLKGYDFSSLAVRASCVSLGGQ